MTPRLRRLFCLAACLWAVGQAQAPAPAPAAIPEVAIDALGRDNPRGTVLGFLSVSRKNDFQTAAKYLNTRLTGKAAADLAHELFVVLDLRLPPRLNEISDKPGGSRSDLGNPDQDFVGTITTDTAKADILVERVVKGKNPPVWLFSSKTLDEIPDIYETLSAVPIENLVPAFLVQARIGQIALFHLLALFVGMPLIYAATVFVGRIARPYAGRLRRRILKRQNLPDFEVIPGPLRLLILAAVIDWALNRVGIPLLARQVWSSIAWVLTAAAGIWLLVHLNALLEHLVRRRFANAGARSVLHLGRRVADILVIFAGAVFALYHFGFNPTTALAGLGIGGIAVAFAAQKTLENVIGGISIIFDQVVRVGDFLKAGDTIGEVDSIGLRSTRIRTLDRTLVSVPNGLISGVTLETISARDKYWFHHLVGLRYDTTAAQMRSVLEGVTELLALHPRVERESVRVRFIAFAASSLNIELFAYIFADDFAHFLQIQGDLLIDVMKVVESSGAHIAFPSTTLYLETPTAQAALAPAGDHALAHTDASANRPQ